MIDIAYVVTVVIPIVIHVLSALVSWYTNTKTQNAVNASNANNINPKS